MADRAPLLAFERLVIDRTAWEAWAFGDDGQPVPLTLARADFEILAALASRPKVVLSARDLAALTHTAKGAVTEHVRRVRAAVGADRIATVRGVGYRWDSRPVHDNPRDD